MQQHRPDDHLLCVAVIDDDATIRNIMREILQDGDYRVVLWDGLEDPLVFIDRCHPDLIVQDVRLGQALTIWPLLDHLDALPDAHTPQVIVCSADRDFLRAHSQTLQDRSCAIVAKPFDIDDFLNAVASCLATLRR